MKGYGQFCPVAKAAEVVGERWTMLVIRELMAGSQSFNDIRRGVPLMSPSLLSARLKQLEQAGVVLRNESTDGVTYTLTQAGEELRPLIFQMGVWGQRWVRSKLSKGDLDPTLLMWDMKRRIDMAWFSKTRTVLSVEFSDSAVNLKYWWLIVHRKSVDLCLKDPGYEVDLYIVSDVKTLTEVWMGDMSLRTALQDGLLEISGMASLRKTMSKWLGRNVFADVKSRLT